MFAFQRLFLVFTSFLLLSLTFATQANSDKGGNIEIRTLEDIALYPQRSAPAAVISLHQTSVSARIQAQVTAIQAQVGDSVAQDAVLVQLDCADLELALAAAEAQLQGIQARIRLANKRLNRTKSLRKQKSASEETFDERVTDLSVLRADRQAQQANIQKAQLDITRCVVTTPYHALVTERHVSVGSYVQPGDPLVTLLDKQSLEISAQVSSLDASQIENNPSLMFEHNNQLFSLNLRIVSPVIDSLTRNQEVRLLFAEKSALPGAAGKLLWRDPRPHIPAGLLVQRDGQAGIYLVKEQQAYFMPLPNAQTGRASPVDLPLTTQLVVKGQFALRDGQSLSGKHHP